MIKQTIIALALFASTTVVATPNLTPVQPPCVVDSSALPIHVIEVTEQRGDYFSLGRGTIFLIAKDTWVTAAHVIVPTEKDTDEAGDVVAMFLNIRLTKDYQIPATLVALDTEQDVAIIRAPSGDLVPMTLNRDGVELKDTIYTLGYPSFAGSVLQNYSGSVIEFRDDGKLTSNSYVYSGMSGGPATVCNGGDLEVIGAIHGFSNLVEQRTMETADGTVVLEYYYGSGEGIIATDLESVLDQTNK